MRDRFSARVTVIVAPAGFGKTTLLAQAVAENQLDPLGSDFWLTCGSDDSAGSSLAQGLCRAMDVPPARGVDDAIEKVVETVWHHAPRDVALVIDDIHEITGKSTGADALAQLLASAPRNGHFVFCGRRAPPVALSRLEVEGDVIRLAESELLFSQDELAAFATARNVPGDRLTGCGGWPALAELSASSVGGVEGDYLWEEVLERIRPDRRRDLALLAHVGPVDDALATSVLGRATDVAELMGELPLVAVTADGARQLHPLWRPHLAPMVDESEIAEARRRAGTETARAGDLTTAIRLLTDAGAWDQVTHLIADVLAVPDPRLPGDVVEGWMSRLPETMKDGPLAQLLRAACGTWSEPVGAELALEAAAKAFRLDQNLAGEMACLAQLARLAWIFERPEKIIGIAARLFELESLEYDKARPLACLARAAIAQPMGNWEAALTELDSVPARSLSAPWQSVAEWLRSMCLNHLGRPGEALTAIRRARDSDSPLPVPALEAVRLHALWLRGEIDDVVHELPAFLSRVSATGLSDFVAYMTAAGSMVAAIAGRTEDATKHLEHARRAAPTSPAVPMVDANLAIAEATLAVASADEPRAVRLLEHHLQGSPPLETGLTALVHHTMLALWYVLVPDSRRTWDHAPLGPCFVVSRSLARDLVAVRQTGRLPAGASRLPAPRVVRSALPVPWATELALAHIATGTEDGWALLESLWPVAQVDVRRHATETGRPLSRPARTALARLPVPPPGRLELKLLGPVELRRDGVLVELPDWRRVRVRSLLAHLVLHGSVSRERLAADLWPTLDVESRSHNLRVNLAHLRRVLEPDRADRDASFLIRTHGGNLVLHHDGWLDTDVWLFDELWQRAAAADDQGLPSAALDAMRQAVPLWRDDPSELADNGWALPDVEERRLRLVRMATRAGELLLARDDADSARHMGERALRIDPWCEPAYRIVAAAHVALGDHRSAGKAIERYRAARADLGLEP